MHKHHIVPRYMGGSDNEENLVELSIDDHAEEHRKLFELYGNWQDYVAWKGLSGLMTKEEIVKQIQSNAGKIRIQKYGNPFSGIRTQTNFSINQELRIKASILSNTNEAITKKRKTMLERNHQQGNKNSQFGSLWCVEENAVDLSSRRKFKEIPDGWITTTEWKNRRKDKTNNAYGRHWYNDGIRNYYLKESDPKVSQLIRGRI